MHFYAQRWSDLASTWMVEGDEYRTIDEAAAQLGRMKADHPGQGEDEFRITVYSTPLTSGNAALRLSR